jgi:microcystin-dependent protein
MALLLTNVEGQLKSNDNYVTPVGSVMCFAGASAPAGWLFCDGSEVLKNDYLDLFNVIQNNYGTASDSTKFVLPDLRQRMAIGKSSSNNLGGNGGNQSITLTEGQMPSHSHTGTTSSEGAHSHTATDSGHVHTYTDAYFAENSGGAQNNVFGTSAGTDGDNEYIYRTPNPTTETGYANISIANNGSHTHTFTTSTTGSGSSIDIMNPYVVLNYIIKF